MAIAEVTGGTQTAVINTEHTLATSTTGKTYVLAVDSANMVNNDILELRLYTIARAAGTERLAYYALFAHVQAEPMKYSVPVPANVSLKATLKQTAGVGRDFVWALLSLD